MGVQPLWDAHEERIKTNANNVIGIRDLFIIQNLLYKNGLLENLIKKENTFQSKSIFPFILQSCNVPAKLLWSDPQNKSYCNIKQSHTDKISTFLTEIDKIDEVKCN